jgi:DNA-binding NtrC family response regulator
METERSEKIRVLAVISAEKQEEVRRQIVSFGMEPVLVSRAAQLAPLIRSGEPCQVVLLPASLPNTGDWWAIWGELAMLSPKPVILVYAPAASFQLWSGVLEAGAYDLIVEPLTDAKLKDALLRAAESYDSSDKST